MSKGKVIPIDIFDQTRKVIEEKNEPIHILATEKYYIYTTEVGM